MADFKHSLVWLRNDLRVDDNPALHAACERSEYVTCCYILDDNVHGDLKMGAASRVWLYYSLKSLAKSLAQYNIRLVLAKSDSLAALGDWVKAGSCDALFWNRLYDQPSIERDKQIKAHFKDDGVDVTSCKGICLFEPWEIENKSGDPYRVYTPFRKACEANVTLIGAPLGRPQKLTHSYGGEMKSDELSDFDLLPKIQWHQKMLETWEVGEEAAHKRLADFCEDGLSDYKQGRDCPGIEKVSRLAPYLHFGEISPRVVWHRAQEFYNRASKESSRASASTFLSELLWREFSISLLYYNPQMTEKPLMEKFENFPWRKDSKGLKAWQTGQTGYPIVDAGMRQLWQEGYMHNRVRMIVASFLVKHQLIPWQDGMQWFWDCLFDADYANNTASWQWVAGCGADAAPYFRIFNPVTQGERFDKAGTYVKKYVPEIADLPEKYIHQPWEAPREVLSKAGLTLGEDYPQPVVGLKEGRDRALDAYNEIKGD